MIGNVTRDGLVTSAPRCPQWWQVFAVRGTREMRRVCADNIVHGIMGCTCPSFEYRGREDTCKHVLRVMRHACLAAPGHPAGPNDAEKFGVSVLSCEHPRPRLARRIHRRCACGELMLAPELRLTNEAGHQIVRVVIDVDEKEKEYSYAWAGEPALRAGDAVTINRPGYLRGTVVGLGSDWAGSWTAVREKLKR
jgi:hypothetical protein